MAMVKYRIVIDIEISDDDDPELISSNLHKLCYAFEAKVKSDLRGDLNIGEVESWHDGCALQCS